MIHLYNTSEEPVEEGEKWKRKVLSEFPDEAFGFRAARVRGVNADVISRIKENDNFDLLVFTRTHKDLMTKLMSKSLTWDVAKNINTPTLFVQGYSTIQKPRMKQWISHASKQKKTEADRLPFYVIIYISDFYNPTVHPLAHSGVSTPAPAPVAEASSVKTAL